MRIANAIMSILFVFSAAVQLNDPDPLPWMAMYLSAAAVSGWMAASRPRTTVERAVPFALAAVAAVWAGLIASHTSGPVEPWQLFESWEMQSTAIEERRESYGLCIVALWMVIAGAARARQS